MLLLSQKLFQAAFVGCDGVGGSSNRATDDDIVRTNLACARRRRDAHLVVARGVGEADTRGYRNEIAAAAALDDLRFERRTNHAVQPCFAGVVGIMGDGLVYGRASSSVTPEREIAMENAPSIA